MKYFSFEINKIKNIDSLFYVLEFANVDFYIKNNILYVNKLHINENQLKKLYLK